MMKHSQLKITASACLFSIGCLLPYFSIAQAGSLDLTFGTGGIVTTDIGSNNTFRNAVAIQEDGKIVVAGTHYDGAIAGISLARYNTDGTLDNTFGTGGIVTTEFGFCFSVALQEDGKIVVAGSSDFDFSVARYNSDGTLDSTFGAGGEVTTDFGNSFFEEGNAIAIQPDGKIVEAGIVDVSGLNAYEFGMVRYQIDGTLDNTFGVEGKVTTFITDNMDYAEAVAIQPDGKIIAAGFSGPESEYKNTLVRYNEDGSLDNTFGIDGIVTTTIGLYTRCYSIAIQPDGKILTAGYTHLPLSLTTDFVVARYTTNGNLDNTFGSDGVITIDFDGGSDFGYCITIQPDGKIVIIGSNYAAVTKIAVARCNSDGTLDNTFGTGGIVTTPIEIYNCDGWGVALQTDGKIVVAGYSNDWLNFSFAVVRYNGEDQVDIQPETANPNFNINVSPNPFSNELNISYKESDSRTGEITLYDISGNKILQQEFVDPAIKINTENLLPGVYLLQYRDGIQSKSFILVKNE